MHNLPTLKHSQKEGTLTLLLSSPLGRSAGRSLLLGHAPCVMFPPPREGRGSRPLSPLLPRRTAGGQFWRLRPASLGAPTLPPPAPAAAGGPFVRLRARAPALSLRSVESVSLSESVRGAGGAKGLRRGGCRIICFPLPLSRPTSLFTPLLPSLAQPWRSRRRPLSPHQCPRRPPGPSRPRPAAAAGAREPAPPWGRRAAAPPVRVRRAGGPRPREGAEGTRRKADRPPRRRRPPRETGV